MPVGLSKSSKEYHAKPDVKKASSERAKINNKKYNFRELVKNSDKFKKALEEGRVGCGIKSSLCKEKLSETVLNYYKEIDDDGNLINIIKHRKAIAKAVGTKVAQYNIEGNFIKVYESASEAARSAGLKSKGSILRILNGSSKSNISAGFIWKKYEESKDSDNLIEHV